MAESHARGHYRRKHRALVDEVADHANVRRDVVEDVLNGFYDIMAERLLNERRFEITEILSVQAVSTKNGIRPEPHLQFRAKVAFGLRKLLQRTEEEPDLRVDRYNWKELARALKPSTRRKPRAMELNDFLRDDDED